MLIFNRSEEHTSELQSHHDLVCRLLLEKKNILAHTGTLMFIPALRTYRQYVTLVLYIHVALIASVS